MTNQTTTDRSISSALELAHLCGWDDDSLRSRQIRRGGTELDVARVSIGGEPAFLFAKTTAQNGHDPLGVAALYGYHAHTGWGALADSNHTITVFHSHRLNRDQWLTLPPDLRLRDGSSLGTLEGFRPDNLRQHILDRSIRGAPATTSILRPVDERLVATLDQWRDEALRHSDDPSKTDSHLQTTYAQFFVLRSVEDRELAPQVPPLSSVVRAGRVDYSAWDALIGAARATIGSQTFQDDVLSHLPSHVVAGIVSDLYSAPGLPGDVTYNFSWLEADILGSAYERYLGSILQPAALLPQMELFDAPKREVDRVSVRNATGTFYTPAFLHRFLAQLNVDEYFKNGFDGHTIPRVIDFACGSGSFLVAAVDRLLYHLKKADPERNWARELVEGGHIAGVDVNANSVKLARTNLWNRLVEEPNALPLPSLEQVVIQGDGLRPESWGALNRTYDIVLGNPPFLVTSGVPQRRELEQRFDSAKGRYDYGYLFVEQGVKIAAENGLIGMVVPNRLFTNKYATAIRQFVIENTNIEVILDFGSTRPFKDASVYVGCVVLRRTTSADRSEHTRVIEVDDIDASYFSALLLEAYEHDSLGPSVRSFHAPQPNHSGLWQFVSTEELKRRIALIDMSTPLGECGGIYQGIRTGANDIFIVAVGGGDGRLSKCTNNLGESFVLETALLRPVAFGTDLQRYEVAKSGSYLLYPYAHGEVIKSDELAERYPYAWEYLKRHETVLASRGSLTGQMAFYSLVRPRDESWLVQPKIVTRDLVREPSFASDLTGGIHLVGGTAIVPSDPETVPRLLAYLNSSPIGEYLEQVAPVFRGGFRKLEPQHLRDLPVLNDLLGETNFADQLHELSLMILNHETDGISASDIENEIDEKVRERIAQVGS